MTVIEIGQIMVPDPNWGNHWIPIPSEDSCIDHKCTGMEAIVIRRIGYDKLIFKHLNYGTELIGIIDNSKYIINIPNPQEEKSPEKDWFWDAIGVPGDPRENKPFLTKKKCESCNEDYPDDFKYCEKCGRELDVVQGRSDMNNDGKIGNIFSSIPKSEVPLYKKRWG